MGSYYPHLAERTHGFKALIICIGANTVTAWDKITGFLDFKLELLVAGFIIVLFYKIQGQLIYTTEQMNKPTELHSIANTDL